MKGYKRNQAVEAISISVGQGPRATAELRTELKRLLDTDRNLDRLPSDLERANYAFFTGEAPGRGTEVEFSGYETFALLIGLNLMEHGWPQATAVSILRQARPVLEPKHAQILRWDPATLFDEEKIRGPAKPGALAASTTRPVYLVITSLKGRPRERDTDDTREVAVLENDKLMPFLLREAGRSSTMIELTRMAHALHAALVKTKPSKRGRGSS